MALRAVSDHPKFADLKARLALPKYAVMGCLEAIWHFTGRYTPQGNIGKYPDSAIEAWVEWSGAPGALISSLIASHWIDEHATHRLVVHDWAHHADKATKNALHRASAKFCVPVVRTKRKHVRTLYRESGTVSRLPEPEPVPEPEPEKKAKSCAETSSAPALDGDGAPLTLPMVTGVEWVVAAADCLEWAKAYPAVNVLTELLRMRVWLTANPRNRKTPGGMRRFVANWLGRAQNSAPVGGLNATSSFARGNQARAAANDDAATRAASAIRDRFTSVHGGGAGS